VSAVQAAELVAAIRDFLSAGFYMSSEDAARRAAWLTGVLDGAVEDNSFDAALRVIRNAPEQPWKP